MDTVAHKTLMGIAPLSQKYEYKRGKVTIGNPYLLSQNNVMGIGSS